MFFVIHIINLTKGIIMTITKVLWPSIGNLYEQIVSKRNKQTIVIPNADDHSISARNRDVTKVAWFKSELRSHAEQRRICKLIEDKYPMVYDFVMHQQSK
jgi:hypothetical protein